MLKTEPHTQFNANAKTEPHTQFNANAKTEPHTQFNANAKTEPHTQFNANAKTEPHTQFNANAKSSLSSKLKAQLHSQLGSIGEKVAASLLRQKGYRILYCNWRQWRHELDLVVQDQDNTLVFVEVRTRTQAAAALTSMTRKKCQSLLAAAQAFLQAQNLWSSPCRFDLICVENHGKTLKPEHYINIDLTPAMAKTSWQPW